MRLHHLTLSAFGPFAEPNTVDFETLTDAGLFLIRGVNGAGKTTLLDAISFAVFGSIPGTRSTKELHCDHADPERAPEVTLEFSIEGERLRIIRTPEWQRPKRRGTGTTREPSRARLLRIHDDGREELITARAAECGVYVRQRLPLTAEQFHQLVVLPQGGFSGFLLADSRSRTQLLQDLFGTRRFEDIESWMGDHQRELQQQCVAVQTELTAELVRLVHEFSAVAPLADDVLASPEGIGFAQLTEAGTALLTEFGDISTAQAVIAGGALDCWSLDARAGLERLRQTSAAHADVAHAELVRAHELLQRIVEHEAAQARLIAVQDQLAGLPSPTELEAWGEGLDRARSAQEGGALLQAQQSAAAELADHADEAAAWRERLPRPRPTEQQLTSWRLACGAAVGAVRDLDQAVRTLAAARRDQEATATSLVAADAHLQEAQRDGEQQRESLLDSEALARQRQSCEAELSVLAEQRLAAERFAASLQQSHELSRLATETQEQLGAAEAALTDVLQRRLAGMAADLSGSLIAGEACPVCGSCEHPRPAPPDHDVPSQEAVGEARQVIADQTTRLRELTLLLHDESTLQVQCSVTTGGLTLADLDERHAALRSQHAELGDLIENAVTAERERIQWEQRIESARAAVADLQSRLGLLDAQVSEHSATAQTLRAEASAHFDVLADVAAAAGDTERHAVLGGFVAAAEELPQVLTVLQGWSALLDRWSAAEARLTQVEVLTQRTQQVLTEAETRLQTWLDHSPFADFDAMMSASLTPSEAADRERQLAVATDSRLRLSIERDRLAETISASPPGDRGEVEQRITLLQAQARRQQEQAALVRSGSQRFAGLLDCVTDLRRRWIPLATDYLRVKSLSDLVRGHSPDNRLRMRLSAYVLATRLDAVLAAANERLAQMQEQRYVFERVAVAARARAQSGLDIKLQDTWTGTQRDPNNLSGGETFVLSLALCLGLADVTSDEAGGVRLQSLFVDEGFGALDADTLEDVMDRLDELRAGGRAVGIISHVTELAHRIPMHLEVRKTPQGSGIVQPQRPELALLAT